ncbi:MAG: DUF4177 domain-containing protein [Chitinophagaceae bacterium]
MKKFEYTVIDVPTTGFWSRKVDYEALSSKLNELGNKGWEVAATTDTTTYQSASRAVIIILKRELYQ